MTNYKRILVAVDGSDQSEAAFYEAVNLAKALGSSLSLASVIDVRSFPTFTAEGRTWEAELRADVEEILAKYVQIAKEKGVESVGTFLEVGNPKKLLTEEIPDLYGADLIVCGATGLSRLEKVLMGSISSYIVKHAKCNVLIAR
ncbi:MULTISPECIES: universal stress protein [Listeria]|uniref:universal stress protein n=1 Tax=Listeria TaxID=1637 RepID=UPI000B59490C|nr:MULTISPECIES: universal stress protein [Listeria]